jgi:hypothetical protein
MWDGVVLLKGHRRCRHGSRLLVVGYTDIDQILMSEFLDGLNVSLLISKSGHLTAQ